MDAFCRLFGCRKPRDDDGGEYAVDNGRPCVELLRDDEVASSTPTRFSGAASPPSGSASPASSCAPSPARGARSRRGDRARAARPSTPRAAGTSSTASIRRDEDDNGRPRPSPGTSKTLFDKKPTAKKQKVDEGRSPALPAAWQLVAQLKDEDGALTKDVDLEILGGGDDGDDDDELFEDGGAITFSEAWRSFKSQEETGFGKLREYVAKNYAALLRKMLSPRREPFDGAALGPSGFEFRGRRVRRDDFAVQNDRGLELACSLWRDEGHGAPGAPPSPGGFRPLSRFRSAKKDRRFCVLYVHDVGGSRLGALSCLGVALDAGAAGYCAFDTTACGRSGGAHVSFGHFERWGVGAVAQELVKRRGFTDVVLWGRGAGAVAALLYARFAQAPPAKRRSSKESWWSDYYGGGGGPAGAGPGACECDEHGYPKRRPRAVDVFSQGSTTRGGISTCPDYEGDEAARAKAARSFLRGLEVSTMTVMWVVSKPPLYVSAVAKGSAAADCGLEVIAGIGSSMRLPHTADEFAEILLKLAERPRPDLVVHVYRDATAGELAAPPCPYPQHPEARANFDPTAIKGTDVAAAVRNVPALFAVNDFSDLDRGIPKLAALTSTVYDAYKGGAKSLVRYNSPLRLALRGTRVAPGPRPSFPSPTPVSSRRLDAMSSKFLNKAFVFLQGLDGFEPVPTTAAGAGGAAMPRWVVTTRPWAQTEAEQTIDDYESAQIVFDQGGQGS
ncbi:palmitoyl-(protein) hydrolase [Aureococcus anophagefferens]|nr:palmitoyl-(protein) hydrolase [Aureococcus anophagefferens]